MGRTTLKIANLFFPLDSIHERINAVPHHRSLSINNEAPKAVFFVSGGLELEQPDGTKRILREGDAYFSARKEKVRYRCLTPHRETKLHALVVRFQANLCSARRAQESEKSFLSALRLALSGFAFFPRRETGGKLRLLHELLRVMELTDPSASWIASGLCISLLSSYLTQSDGTPDNKRWSKKAGRAVEHVSQYIQEHFHDPLTLPDLAWRVRLSPEHLARLFRQTMGETVFSYLDQVRIEQAKRLLRTTDWPISEVAHACGFSSSNLFCRHFKLRTKRTALELRLAQQEGESFTAAAFGET